MTVQVKLYIPVNAEIAPLGVMIIKNGRGYFLTLEEAEKVASEIQEILRELKNIRREVKQLAP